MRRMVLALCCVTLFALAAIFVSAIDKADSVAGAAVDAEGASTSFTESTAGSDGAQGGNVTELNLTTTASTTKWQGYFGSVTAGLRLGSGNDVLYNFGNVGSGQIKSVFASTDSAFNFGNLIAATAANIDTTWGFTTGDSDSGTSTFTGSSTISQVASVPSIALNAYNASGASDDGIYATGVFKDDGTVAAGSYGVLAFGVSVDENERDFSNSTEVDYELIVPVNTSGSAGTQTFFFFMDLE